MQGKRSAFLAFIAVLFTVSALFFTNRAVTPKVATWDEVLSQAEAGGYRIMGVEELATRYRTDPTQLLLVDTRQEWEYRAGHIKGAVNFPMEPTGWARWRKAGSLEAFLGSEKDRTVVFY
jgi:3-mercaptopyruvate sulfurtransferase SseA